MKKKITVKRFIIFIIFVTMCVSLVACGEDNRTQFIPSSDSESFTEKQLDDNQNIDKTDSFDLSNETFTVANPFSEGYAWVYNYNNYSSESMVIDRSGNILCHSDESYGEFGSEFEEGASFIDFPNDYESNDIIVDIHGNILYTLPNTEECTEECIAKGDGYYLIKRTIKNIDINGTYYVVIDKTGNDLTEPVDVGGYLYSNSEDSAYHGEGVFSVYYPTASNRCDWRLIDINNPSDYLPYPTDKYFNYWIYDHPFKNGKTWLKAEVQRNGDHGWPSGVALYDIHSTEYNLVEAKNYVTCGNFAIADGILYDINGNTVCTIDNYVEKICACSPLSEEGYIALLLEGEDNNYYITYADKQGHVVMEPIKCTGREYGFFDENHYCVVDEGTVTVYKPNGTKVVQVSASNLEHLGDDYIICDNRYYFF